MASEFDLFKRRIVPPVIAWLDEDCRFPSVFVERTGDGRYDAVAIVLVEGIGGEPNDAREYSLGIFDDKEVAIEIAKGFVARANAGMAARLAAASAGCVP
jgi:hypothetical protein